MRIIKILILILISSNCFAQDTTVLKKQKGFLFLSSQHYMYDWPNGDEMRTGFSDYFFPSENFDKNCFLDSNKSISFKNGVRVEFFKSRNQLKSKSIKLNCTNNGCYFYDSFYVIPVVIDYKLFKDDWPLDCRSEFFDIDVIKGSKLRFYHERRAIAPTKVTAILPVDNRKSKRDKK